MIGVWFCFISVKICGVRWLCFRTLIQNDGGPVSKSPRQESGSVIRLVSVFMVVVIEMYDVERSLHLMWF